MTAHAPATVDDDFDIPFDDTPGERLGRRRLEWLGKIAANRNITHLQARVAIALAGFINTKSGEAWPSQARLAESIGADVRTVRRALSALVTLGFLESVSTGRGRGIASRYRMAFPCET